MSFRQSLSIVDSSNFQPQEPSPTSKLTSVFSRQRLDPIPLLKQKLPHVKYSILIMSSFEQFTIIVTAIFYPLKKQQYQVVRLQRHRVIS